jgi:hypothetical protein
MIFGAQSKKVICLGKVDCVGVGVMVASRGMKTANGREWNGLNDERRIFRP